MSKCEHEWETQTVDSACIGELGEHGDGTYYFCGTISLWCRHCACKGILLLNDDEATMELRSV